MQEITEINHLIVSTTQSTPSTKLNNKQIESLREKLQAPQIVEVEQITYADLLKAWPKQPSQNCYDVVQNMLEKPPSGSEAIKLIVRLTDFAGKKFKSNIDLTNFNMPKSTSITPLLLKLVQRDNAYSVHSDSISGLSSAELKVLLSEILILLELSTRITKRPMGQNFHNQVLELIDAVITNNHTTIVVHKNLKTACRLIKKQIDEFNAYENALSQLRLFLAQPQQEKSNQVRITKLIF